MKKLTIIAVASSFLFISCAKVDTTPDSQRNATQVEKSPSPQQYLITNTETAQGVVAYKIQYTDVNNVVHTVALSMGQSILVCLTSPVIETNFAHTMVLVGNC